MYNYEVQITTMIELVSILSAFRTFKLGCSTVSLKDLDRDFVKDYYYLSTL